MLQLTKMLNIRNQRYYAEKLYFLFIVNASLSHIHLKGTSKMFSLEHYKTPPARYAVPSTNLLIFCHLSATNTKNTSRDEITEVELIAVYV